MPSKSQSILMGAAVYVVASLITGFVALNGGTAGQYLSSVLCCLVAMAGPAVAIWHYTTTNNLTISAGTGAGMGALTVVLGGVVSYAITKVLQVVGAYPSDDEIVERARQQMLDQGMDPAQVDGAMGMVEMTSGVVGVLINLVVAAIIGAIAGAIAASVFKRGAAVDDV